MTLELQDSLVLLATLVHKDLLEHQEEVDHLVQEVTQVHKELLELLDQLVLQDLLDLQAIKV